MRAGNTYRGERRREAKAAGLAWRFIDAVVDVSGTRRVTYPFQRMGKAATAEAIEASRKSARAADSSPPASDKRRYNAAEVARLTKERGVGPVGRIAEAVRATFVRTKRKGK